MVALLLVHSHLKLAVVTTNWLLLLPVPKLAEHLIWKYPFDMLDHVQDGWCGGTTTGPTSAPTTTTTAAPGVGKISFVRYNMDRQLKW